MLHVRIRSAKATNKPAMNQGSQRSAIILGMGILMVAPLGGALAEVKCEVRTTTCIDARTGQARVCSTTICRDENGKTISVDTVVLKGDSNSVDATEPRAKGQIHELTPTKKIDKSSPK